MGNKWWRWKNNTGEPDTYHQINGDAIDDNVNKTVV